MNYWLALVLCVSALLSACSSDDGAPTHPPANEPVLVRGTDSWNWHEVPFAEDLRAVACSGIGGIIVGTNYTVKQSGDGRNWSTWGWGGESDLQAAAAFGERFVAVGTGGAIFSRGTSQSWSGYMDPNRTLRAVAWSGEIGVAVGDDGSCATSVDGLNWVNRPAITDRDLSAVTWTGDHFLCGGEGGFLFSSVDGIVWALESSPIVSNINCLALTNSVLRAVTEQGDIWRLGHDGWMREFTGHGTALRAIAALGSRVVAVGDHATVVLGRNTIGWEEWHPDIDTDFLGISVANGFTVVGSNRVVLVSVDGMLWEQRPSSPPFDLSEIATNGDDYVVVGHHGILRSADGVVWQNAWYAEYSYMYSVTWAGDRYVACGKGGLVLTSPDGVSWSVLPGLGDINLWCVEWNGTETKIGGDLGKLFITHDYVEWEEITLPRPGAISGFAHSADMTVAVMANGPVYTSVDGRNWTARGGNGAESVIWTGSQFVAVSLSSGDSSIDGIHWTPIPGGYFNDIAFDGERYYGVGAFGLISWSTDLIQWNRDTSGFEQSDSPFSGFSEFSSVRICNGRMFVVGDGGVILERN